MPKMPSDPVEHGANLVHALEVRAEDRGAMALSSGAFRVLARIVVVNRDPRPFCGKRERYGPSDPLRRPGDENDLPFQAHPPTCGSAARISSSCRDTGWAGGSGRRPLQFAQVQ